MANFNQNDKNQKHLKREGFELLMDCNKISSVASYHTLKF